MWQNIVKIFLTNDQEFLKHVKGVMEISELQTSDTLKGKKTAKAFHLAHIL